MVAQVTCPTCKNKSIWSEANAARPFCSQRCKDIDLGAWASDAYVVEGASPSTLEELEAIEQAIEKQLS
jgi:endogenous inhibitor of DNA gyrase (YacG/DUF329 family)